MDQDRDSLGTFAPIRRKLQAQMRALWLHGLLVVYMTFNAGSAQWVITPSKLPTNRRDLCTRS
jgi:hypothetical protein